MTNRVVLAPPDVEEGLALSIKVSAASVIVTVVAVGEASTVAGSVVGEAVGVSGIAVAVGSSVAGSAVGDGSRVAGKAVGDAMTVANDSIDDERPVTASSDSNSGTVDIWAADTAAGTGMGDVFSKA